MRFESFSTIANGLENMFIKRQQKIVVLLLAQNDHNDTLIHRCLPSVPQSSGVKAAPAGR